MSAKTIMTAFIAALLLAVSEAGPCKPRPRTTDTLTTIEVTSSSAKTTSTTDVSSDGYLISTTDQSEIETSTVSMYTTTTFALAISTAVISSSIAVASSIIESSVEPTTVTDDATTTAVLTTSTTGLSSTITESHTQTLTFSEDTTAFAVLTTETSSTREPSSEMTESSTEESTATEDSTTTTLPTTSATELSSTVVESSTGIASITEDATTTAISAIATSSVVDISSTIIESSTEIATSSQQPTGAASISTPGLIPTTTTEGTTTSEVTTTTTTEAAGPPTITNLTFDDTTEPWSVTQPNLVSLALDSNIKHDGRSSARMSFSPAGGSITYIYQTFSSPPQAGVGYPASAWVRPGDGCTVAALSCTYGNAGLFAGRQFFVVAAVGTQPGTINQWQEISYTCTYTQAQIDQGGLALNIGFMCNAGSEAWIDSVAFSGS
ncbi:hypothetical protein FNYG_06560 [Fusarium nygamai]|uniref:CBM-cenC domain-containing protein n=1 Tax=Gibberella nygamai TaxID=42673 RepID=A0A2K0WC61_GIBNY|nr:hypothetical protein FNYG_06560 [Fusarium nygamai]